MPDCATTAAARQRLRRCGTAAAFMAMACGHPGDRAAEATRIDSSGGRSAVEGTPSTRIRPAPRSPAGDSAVVLDRAFQAARRAVNAEAHALDTLAPAMRRTPEYAARFDTLRRATLHAESLRVARDRARAAARRATTQQSRSTG